jgi:hypothetical protein
MARSLKCLALFSLISAQLLLPAVEQTTKNPVGNRRGLEMLRLMPKLRRAQASQGCEFPATHQSNDVETCEHDLTLDEPQAVVKARQQAQAKN